MDLSPIQIAAASNAAVTLVLTIGLAYLWSLRPQEIAPAFWAGALLLQAIRQSLLLTTLEGTPPATVFAGLTAALPPVLIYAGVLHFLDLPRPAWRLYALAGAIVVAIVGAYSRTPIAAASLWIAVSLVALGYFLSGVAFLRHARTERALPILIGLVLCLWAFWVLLYPIAGQTAAGRAWYAIPSGVFLVVVGIGLIVAVQRRLHLHALRAQDELEASNQRFQDFVDTASAWIWEMDTERRVRFISPQVFDSLGIRPEAFIGRRIGQVPGVAATSMSVADAEQIYRPDNVFRDLRVWMTTDDGRRVHLAHSGKPTFDSEGRHTGYRGITIDVTATARLQAALDAVTGAIAHNVGRDYFRVLVERLTSDLGADYALVGRRLSDGRIRTLASFGQGAHQPEIEYELDGTPCAVTLAQHMSVVESRAAALYPRDAILGDLGIDGYAGVALRDAKGEVIGLIAVMTKGPLVDRDLVQTVLMTIAARAGAELERQAAEVALRDSEALFRDVIDTMPIGFHLTDRDGRFVMRNRITDSWTGVDRADALGRTHGDLVKDLPFDVTVVEAELRSVVATGQPLAVERVNRTADGRDRLVLITRYPIFDSGGAVKFVASAQTDLTEVKRLEAQIMESEQRLRALIDNMPIGFHLMDREGRYLMRNRTLESWSTPMESRQFFGRTLRDIAGPDNPDYAYIESEFAEILASRQPIIRERDFVGLGGGRRPALVCRFPLFDGRGDISSVATFITDLSGRRQLEAQVEQSETRLQRVVTALDRSHKGVIVEDANNRPIYVNRTAGDLMGSEASAIAMLERAGIGAELEAHGAWSGEVIHRTRSGRDAILQASISRLPDGGAVTLLDDATERLERERRQAALEREVQEAQKMDAVGQLAGGIAHDFNNLIGAILGFSRFIAEDTEPASPVHGYAERILSASQRARELIQQMLSFSRRENAPRQPAPLTRLVEESAQLLRATLPSTLSIEVRNDFPEAWSIVNSTQITQILVNLCLNAADAMGGQPGTLTLALERLPDTDPRLRGLIASDPGSLPRIERAAEPGGPSRCYVGALRTGCPYLVLSVRDGGSGIPPDILTKIFDPFFTTKPRGQGTGLGLPVVHRLVLAHDGALVITTRPGHGSTFDVILPVSGRSNRDIVDAINNIHTGVPAPAPASPKSRILVVDDDLHFGDMVSTALDRAGYEVGVCGRPREALDVFAEQPTLWDVVVTDQTMPEMSGLEMIGRLKSLHPGLRCVLCTGYASSSLNAATARAGGADVFFHKPVDVEALIAAITAFTGPVRGSGPGAGGAA